MLVGTEQEDEWFELLGQVLVVHRLDGMDAVPLAKEHDEEEGGDTQRICPYATRVGERWGWVRRACAVGLGAVPRAACRCCIVRLDSLTDEDH